MTIIKQKTFNFGKIDYYGTGRKINAVEVEVELRDDNILAICGSIWNSKKTDEITAGQNLDEIKKYIKNDTFDLIYELWSGYHLKHISENHPVFAEISKLLK